MNAIKPLRRNDIISRKVGDEWIVYDSENGSVHVLNGAAEFVLRLCDGSHSLSEIEMQIQDVYDISEGTLVRKDLEEIYHTFTKLGVIIA
jgi:PqqD family protein of HPr-rel-A system